MKFDKQKLDYIIPMILFTISRNDFIRKYMEYLSVSAIFIYFLLIPIDIFLLFNRQKYCNIKNRYIQNRIRSLKENMSEIKKDTLDYIFKYEIYYLFTAGILLFFMHKAEIFVILQIITGIMVITSAYKILLIFIYNEVPEIYYYISKFIIKRVEKNMQMKEEKIFIISLAKLFIIAIDIVMMLINMI